ncbi:MAG: hypothetical protein KatS3mg077_0068 [Candidatus Binatia bacterium]|nr:MAG: hypothetical protein KatS3mg077_0068 [Candidatus Binatia bacterium]
MSVNLSRVPQKRRPPALIFFLCVCFWYAASSPAQLPPCPGDCSHDNTVTVDEVVLLVRTLLGELTIDSCSSSDSDGNGRITVDEIVRAVQSLLAGCPYRCGNGIRENDEECDNGGLCLGTSQAGRTCLSDLDCFGPGDEWKGVCLGGSKPYSACNHHSDCPGGRCTACWTFGGDGCAANCTVETSLTVELAPPPTPSDRPLLPGRGSFIENLLQGEAVPIPLEGPVEILLGSERLTRRSLVVPASSGRFQPVPIATLACACPRLAEYKTCGGAIFAPDGSYAEICSEGFAVSPATCPSSRPCASVFGPGNAAAGTIGCNGLDPASYEQRLLDPAGPVERVFFGFGDAGTTLLPLAGAVGVASGSCSENVCSAVGPPSLRGIPTVIVLTTAQACTRLSLDDDNPAPNCVTGAPIPCSRWATAELTGLRLCGAAITLTQNSGPVPVRACIEAR